MYIFFLYHEQVYLPWVLSHILALLLIISLFLNESEAAKGGAKSMMGRRKNQQSSSNTHSGYHGHSSQKDKQLQGNIQSTNYENCPTCLLLRV